MAQPIDERFFFYFYSLDKPNLDQRGSQSTNYIFFYFLLYRQTSTNWEAWRIILASRLTTKLNMSIASMAKPIDELLYFLFFSVGKHRPTGNNRSSILHYHFVKNQFFIFLFLSSIFKKEMVIQYGL